MHWICCEGSGKYLFVKTAIQAHYLIHHLSAQVFEKLVENASKLTLKCPNFQNVNEVRFPLYSTKRKSNCNGDPFIICAWCGLPLGFKFFTMNTNRKIAYYRFENI